MWWDPGINFSHDSAWKCKELKWPTPWLNRKKKTHHSTPLEMVLRVNNKLRNSYSRKSAKIQLQKLGVRGIWTKTSSGRRSVHSRLLQPGTVGALSQLPARGLSTFLTLPPATCYSGWVLGKCNGMLGAPFFYLTPISGFEAYLGCGL